MKKGLVYILTNPSLDGWVKIGMTERNDIKARLRELNAPPNIPLSYRCYAVYEVDDPQLVETHIHRIIDRVDDTLHARELLSNGRIREREFFRISPETAYGIFHDVAVLRHEQEQLKLYAPTEEEAEEEEIAERHKKQENTTFQMLGIPVGEKIFFLFDESVTAQVIDEKNSVQYQDEPEPYSVLKLASKLLVENRGWRPKTRVNGWRYFVKDGFALNVLRERIESQGPNEL